MGSFEAARLTVRLGAVASNFREFQRMAGLAQVAALTQLQTLDLSDCKEAHSGTLRALTALQQLGLVPSK